MLDLIRGHRANAAAVLCAFDLLELDGEDLRRDPIEVQKRPEVACCAALIPASRSNDKALCPSSSARPIDPGGLIIGSKTKNPTAPAVRREAEEDWAGRRKAR